MFKGKLRDAIENLSSDLTRLSEFDLHDKVDPTPIDWTLRQRFTDLVANARATGKDNITMTALTDGIMSHAAFFANVVPSPLRVAFLSRPIIEHTAYYAAIHKEAMKKIFEIIKTTDVDPKFLPQILKLAETSANRVYGPVAQKIEMKSKNMNIEMTAKEAQALDQAPTKELTERIAAAQAKLLDSPRDVSPKTED